MKKQVIIAVSREFGSGGHIIAASLARHFNLPLYDKSILDKIAEENGYDSMLLKHYDEKPRNRFTSRKVKGYCNSNEANIANMQFNYLKERAESGESFIVLGRCAEEIFKDFDGLISIFVLADIWFKKERTMDREHLNESAALDLMSKKDLQRKYYHNQYSRGKWGDSRNYDLCINSARLGILKTSDFVIQYVEERLKSDDNI